MKKVIEEEVYLSESAKKLFPKIDFSDTFSTTNHSNTITEVAQLVFETYPKWIAFLLRLRNFLVRFIGLKTDIPNLKGENTNVGFLKTYVHSENELILGADDKHLDFRAIITKSLEEDYNIKLTTLVVYNNRFGKIYMAIVRPFHKLVVKRMLKQAYLKD